MFLPANSLALCCQLCFSARWHQSWVKVSDPQGHLTQQVVSSPRQSNPVQTIWGMQQSWVLPSMALYPIAWCVLPFVRTGTWCFYRKKREYSWLLEGSKLQGLCSKPLLLPSRFGYHWHSVAGACCEPVICG